ncbi:periphilin-1 isoform X2 [Denticeps clupeoides]|uniref:periphilin-1 isoform X2 n=1 Tax=Denticeps clupeoides TaxID=299321 RepID=UPI0010A37373|nr:periphilin-1-like isoform X2 [Denticeps clupeoides]
MANFRRERNIRDAYEERFPAERGAPYPRGERRSFGRPDEEYGRGFDYDNSRFYPNGAPRSYHGDEQRSYHGDGAHFPAARREDSYYYRGPREDPPPGRPMEFRSVGRGPSHPPNVRGQGSYLAPRSLTNLGPEAGDDTIMQAILSLDRSEDREGARRKAPFTGPRERSPLRRDIPPSPHSRSGSSLSSRSFSPDRGKSHPYPPPLKNMGGLSGVPAESSHQRGFAQEQVPVPVPHAKDRPSTFVITSRDGSPHSSASVSKDEAPLTEGPADEAPSTEESTILLDDFQERRAQAIAAKAHEIEKVYRQDCETFGMVVKMLVSKEPSLEKLLQTPLRENLCDIRERCLEDLRGFISDLDDAVHNQEQSV